MTTLLENAPCGYFAFDEHGKIVVVNHTFSTIIGKSKDELVGSKIETLLTLPTRIFFETHFFPTITLSGRVEEMFITLLNASGIQLPMLLNANKIKWNGKTVIACTSFLVQNRKKFEDELLEARRAAEAALLKNTELIKAKDQLKMQTEQLERQLQMVQIQNHELQQFSHAVTHNLKEPLRKILLYSDKLSLELASPALSKVLRASRQMNAVVSGLQEYVWLNETVKVHCQVNLQLIVVELLKRFEEESPQLQFSVNMNMLPIIQGDVEQLKILFNQLISNAVKFRKHDEVRMTIEATNIRRNHYRAMVDKYSYHDFVRIEITDEGVGFDPIYSRDIFNLFRKLHYSEGLGIGLALCKKVVENHGGTIEAESRLNQFTKLSVFLPSWQTNDQDRQG